MSGRRRDLKTTERVNIGEILEAIPELTSHLRRGTRVFELIDRVANRAVAESGFVADGGGETIGEFGHIDFPYRQMGAIDSLDLFGLDELIIFSFYVRNRERYSYVADLGANSGLHTVLMARLGWRVEAYEPDPQHVRVIQRNLLLNGIEGATIHEEAVAAQGGSSQFVRVLGNTTGSHIAGAKANPYGELEAFEVQCESIRSVMSNVDFVKMDVEGHEAKIICSTDLADWRETDIMLEVGTPDNAKEIFGHLSLLGVKMSPQRIGWQQAKSVEDLPSHHSQGSLFVSQQRSSPWD